MSTIDNLADTIHELSIELNIPEDDVSWHKIAVRLARKLNDTQQLISYDEIEEQCTCTKFKGIYVDDKKIRRCLTCKKPGNYHYSHIPHSEPKINS